MTFDLTGPAAFTLQGSLEALDASCCASTGGFADLALENDVGPIFVAFAGFGDTVTVDESGSLPAGHYRLVCRARSSTAVGGCNQFGHHKASYMIALNLTSTRTVIGTTYCSPAVPNSTGLPGRIECTGSEAAGDGDATLVAYDLPPGNVCLFLASANQGLVQPPQSCGNICLMGPDVARFKYDAHVIDDGGKVQMAIDPFVVLTNPPQPIVAGQTWNFQAWHRDSAAMPACNNNFTDAVSVTFR